MGNVEGNILIQADKKVKALEAKVEALAVPEPTRKQATPKAERASTDRVDRPSGTGRGSQRTLSPLMSARSGTPISPTPPGPYLANGVRGGRFGQGTPKSDVDWKIHRAKQVPGPGEYGSPDGSHKVNGGRFSNCKPKSDVEWEMLRASKIPAPGQYAIKDHIPVGGKFSSAKPKSDLDWKMIRAAAVCPPPCESSQTHFCAPRTAFIHMHVYGFFKTCICAQFPSLLLLIAVFPRACPVLTVVFVSRSRVPENMP